MNPLKLTVAAMTLTAVSQLTYAQSAFKSSLPVKPAKGVTVSGTVECDGQPVAGD